jgi:tRNA modification GTPase
VHLDLGGYPVNLLDTAGIRSASEDPIEREGMRRARAAAARANLVLWVVDASDAASVAAVDDEPLAAGVSRWVVLNKIDLLELAAHRTQIVSDASVAHRVSATTGAGLEQLIVAVEKFAERFFTPEPALVTRQRQQAMLAEVKEALAGALELAEDGGGEELVAEQLRRAATGLGRLTGRVDVEEILDVIFREFCVGK